MILDSIHHRDIYTRLGPLFRKAFDFLSETDFNKLSLGKHIIAGDDLFVIIMEYNSKDASECLMESHKKYIDIQYIVDGEELIGITTLNGHTPTVPYDEMKDAVFYNPQHDSLVKLEKGQFAIFFPHDLHMPCIKSGKSSRVKKAVFKVATPGRES